MLVFCLYCCNCHLCYDGGRLGRVKIVTLRVGARAKEEKRGRRGGGEKVDFCNLTCSTLRDGPLFNQYFQIVAVYLTLFTYLQCWTKRDWYAVHLRRQGTASFSVWSLVKK